MTSQSSTVQTILNIDGSPDASTHKRRPDNNERLIDLANRYNARELVAPPHQRLDDAWNTNRRRDWISRLVEVYRGDAQDPLGTICIYMLSTGGQMFLNEGLQRISAVAHALNFPADYGYTEQYIKSVFSMVFIHVQNRVYKDHKEASEDFIRVNQGVGLVPSERHRGILVYAQDWDTKWKPLITEWTDAVKRTTAPYCKSKDLRHQKIEAARQSLQLFCLAHRKEPGAYGSGPELEIKTVLCFETSSPEIVRGHIRRLQDYSAEIGDAWANYRGQQIAKMMYESLGRWCLGVRFLHDEYSPLWWREFFKKLFEVTDGEPKVTFSKNSDKGSKDHLFLTKKINLFNRVCVGLHIDLPNHEERKRKSKPLLAYGYQHDHIQPFADYGDGPTKPVPARQNAAKNARMPSEQAKNVDIFEEDP